MKAKVLLLVALSAVIILTYLGHSNQVWDNHTSKQESFIDYKGISGLIRVNFTKFASVGNTIYTGYISGQISSWSYDDKKKALTLLDTTRKITPTITQNKVIQLLPTKTALVVVTSDGVAKVQKIDSNSKFVGTPTKIDIQESFSKIVLMANQNGTTTNFLTISADAHDLCVYSFKNGLEDPNPVTKLDCNHTTQKYLDADYSASDSVIATGNAKALSLFNYTDNKLNFLTSVFLPKSEQDLFGVMFPPKIQGQNKYILLVNGLWVCSLSYDQKAPNAKILSSEKTQKFLKKGGTTKVSINPSNATEKTVLVNGNGKVTVFTMSMKVGKLTYQNDSKIDEISQFELFNNDQFFRTKGVQFDVYKVKGTQGGISLENQFYQSSPNHFNSVSALAVYQNYMVSTAISGKYNFKLWKNSGTVVSQLDETTYSFFSVLKSGYVNLKTLLLLPPPKKNMNNLNVQTVTETLHILAAGTDPFNLILAPLTSSDKIGIAFKTKEQHYANVTVLLTTVDQSLIISAGMDSLIKLWSLDKQRKNLTFVNTTVVKDGPISFGYNDQTGTKYIFSHSGNDKTTLANISIWQLDEKKQKFTKIASNSAGEASNSNFTAFLKTSDQKYFITMAENGQLRQWQHNDWKSINLVATLSTGYKNVRPVLIQNRLLIQTKNKWIIYLITDRGFVVEKESAKSFESSQTSNMIVKDGIIYSGDKQGCLRIYSLNL